MSPYRTVVGCVCCMHTDIPAWFVILCHLQSRHQDWTSSIWQHKIKAELKQKAPNEVVLCVSRQNRFSNGMALRAKNCKDRKNLPKFSPAFRYTAVRLGMMPCDPPACKHWGFLLHANCQKYWQLINYRLHLSSQSRLLIFITDVDSWWNCREMLECSLYLN